MQRKPWLFVASVLILISTGVLFARYPARFETYFESPPVDFSVYVKAAERTNRGESPYIASEFSPYKYSPGVLALMRLLPAEPDKAWLVFSSMSLGLLALGLLLGSRYQSRESVIWLALGIVLSWKGLLETLDYGQLELMIFGLAILAGALRMRFPMIAGLIAGTIPWFKLPWFLLLFPLILTPVESLNAPGKKPKRIRLLISGYLFASFIWGAAVPSVVFGSFRSMELTRQWMDVLLNQPPELFSNDINQSIWMSAQRWIMSIWGPSYLDLASGGVAVMGGIIFGSLSARSLKVTQNREVFGWLTPWLILTQLLNPVSWRWGSVLLLGAPFAIAGIHRTVGRTVVRSVLILIVGVLWALQLNPVVKALGYHHWSDIHGFGVVTAYWLCLLLLCIQPAERPYLSDLSDITKLPQLSI